MVVRSSVILGGATSEIHPSFETKKSTMSYQQSNQLIVRTVSMRYS
jgi:hypothetical protein